MLTDVEADRATVALTAVDDLLAEMRAAGVPDPVALLRALLEHVRLRELVQTPLLAWSEGEDPALLRWAPAVRDLLVRFDFGDAILNHRVVGRALDTLVLFEGVAT